MMEGTVLPPENVLPPPSREWAVGAADGRARHITSLHLDPAELDALTAARFERYARIAEAETRWETAGSAPGSERRLVIAAYGSSYRSALGAKQLASDAGFDVALFRPITLWPFPARALASFAGHNPVLAVEMSRGQMVEDVKLALFDHSRPNPPPVHFLGHSGGVVPSEEEIFSAAREILAKS
jgi:2-oxoglutarate ferredoxin oxidoreductase subunit alpha